MKQKSKKINANRIKRVAARFLAGILFFSIIASGMSMVSRADTEEEKDYTINSFDFDELFDGIQASWDEPESSTGYTLKLYKGSPYDGNGKEIYRNKIGTTYKTSKEYYNFTKVILENGAGTYTVIMWANKDTDTLYEKTLQVSFDMVSEYAKAGKTGWQYINYHWYYYDSEGKKLTGWIFVNDKWYYLDDNGQCLLNTVTPDGYKVNEKGEWIE